MSTPYRPSKNTRRFVALTLALLTTAVWTVPPTRSARRVPAGEPLTNSNVTAPRQAAEEYGRLGLSFEENRGQTDAQVRFLARGSGYTLFLTGTEAVFALSNTDCAPSSAKATPVLLATQSEGELNGRQAGACAGPAKVLRMKAEGASESSPSAGEARLPGIVNYLIGSDPTKWQTEIPTFGRVRYGEVYPGVDMVYYGREGQLEYDFVVAPGADWRPISLAFEGADAIELDASGDLLLSLGGQTLRQQRPLVYQEFEGERREVESVYELKGGARVGFRLGEYDRARPLVIDPVLIYSTYLGGGFGEVGFAIAVDSAGSAYVTGATSSTNFPTANPIQLTPGGAGDAFVTKLNAAGTARVYSTYLGGSGGENGLGIAVDANGNAYVAGETFSTNFPTANAVQPMSGGDRDAFVTKLNATGTALVYSTYMGGGGVDRAPGIAVDAAGNAYVAGETSSANFPTANALQPMSGGSNDAFVTKLNAAGSTRVYSTYLGGGGADAGVAIAVDSAGSAYVTGQTFSNNFPTTNPVQPLYAGTGDAFVTKLNPAGSTRVYSTYLGGSSTEFGRGIAVDAGGSAYITGQTFSNNFPTANPIQPVLAGMGDAFVTKLNAAGTARVYSTYLGGSDTDEGRGIAVDAAGSAYFIGTTLSANFPTANAVQPVFAGVADAFVTKLNAAGTPLAYSTYLGGSGIDGGFAIAVDAGGSAYVTGQTESTNFPTVSPLQPSAAGDVEAFVTKIGNLIISGRVTGAGGAGVEGVTVLLNGTDSASTLTDAAGNFRFSATTPNGNYTVTPVKPGLAFNPESHSIPSLTSDQHLLFIATADGATPTPTPSPTPTPAVFQFGAASFSVNEGAGAVHLTVTRSGDTSAAATLDFATNDGTANDRGDYTTAIGRLRFGPGDTAQGFDIFITDDGYAEGNETVQLTLSNPSTGALAGGTATALLTIVDNDLALSVTNPVDSTAFFVRQHYVDFLNREPDTSGLAFWIGSIESCGADAACREVKRIDVSAAFFLSIEYQETGFLVERLYRAAFNRLPAYREFVRDTRELGRGVVVGQGAWEAQLEANKRAFVSEFVAGADFLAVYAGLTNEQYVDALNVNTGNSLSAAERNALVAGLNATTLTRATALRQVAEDTDFAARELNRAFVLAQYLGYLRRDPDADGFAFWLAKLNLFGGDFRRAEMVKAFITSDEYRKRFGQ